MDRFLRSLAVVCLLSGFVLLSPQPALAGGEVTECTNDSQLQKRLAAGGLVSFDCGAAEIQLSETQIINTDTTIDGGGLITLSGQSVRRLFVVGQGKSLTLRNITLADGFSEENGGAIVNNGTLVLELATIRHSRVALGSSGGAIASYGPLTITQSTLWGNLAGNGGALYLRFDAGSAVLINSVLSENRAANQVEGFGGAVWLTDGADLTVQGGRLSGNLAREGGAIQTQSSGSMITLQNGVLLRGNQANYGGGIYILNGALDLSRATLLENRASYSGGGGYLESAWAAIDQAVFTRNRAQQSGYQAYGFGGGLAIRSSTNKLSLTRSTFRENVAFYGAGVYLDNARQVSLVAAELSNNQARGAGGGLYLASGSGLDVTASLISGNLAAGNGGGAYIDSGADLTLENVTLSANRAQVTGGGLVNYGRLALRYVTLYENTAPAASGLYHSTVSGAAQATLGLHNTVLAGGLGGANCFLGKAIDEAAYSLSSDESCRLSGPGSENGVAAAFTPLGDNGGPTLTHLPLAGSPVIDSGQCLPGIVTDQRGRSRLAVGDRCDVGAAEVSWPHQVFMPLILLQR